MSADNKQEKLDNVTEKLQAMGVMPGNDSKPQSSATNVKPARLYILLMLMTISAFAATFFVYTSYMARSTTINEKSHAESMNTDNPANNHNTTLSAKKSPSPQAAHGFTNPARGAFQPPHGNKYWMNQPHRTKQPSYSRRSSISQPSDSKNNTIPLNNRRYARNNQPMPYRPAPVRPYYWFNRYQNRWVLYTPRPYPYNNQQPVPYKKR